MEASERHRLHSADRHTIGEVSTGEATVFADSEFREKRNRFESESRCSRDVLARQYVNASYHSQSEFLPSWHTFSVKRLYLIFISAHLHDTRGMIDRIGLETS